MTLQELQAAVTILSTSQLKEFDSWYQLFKAQSVDDDWQRLAKQNLARAFGSDEPDYSTDDLLKP